MIIFFYSFRVRSVYSKFRCQILTSTDVRNAETVNPPVLLNRWLRLVTKAPGASQRCTENKVASSPELSRLAIVSTRLKVTSISQNLHQAWVHSSGWMVLFTRFWTAPALFVNCVCCLQSLMSISLNKHLVSFSLSLSFTSLGISQWWPWKMHSGFICTHGSEHDGKLYNLWNSFSHSSSIVLVFTHHQ